VSAWLWLLGAAVAAAGSLLIGWQAWRSSRVRQGRDLNAERYLAWRGRADHPLAEPGLTRGERQRLAVAAVLAVAAIFCVVGFFSYA
jgi:hypothetical protein